MFARLALALSGLAFSAASLAAGDALLPNQGEWTVDQQTARALRHDPFEHGAVGDRVMFDIARGSDDASGTLTVNCLTLRYDIVLAGIHLLTDDAPLSAWPLAGELASTYCAQVDSLPGAERQTPVAAPWR